MPKPQHRPDADPHAPTAPQDHKRGPHERDRNANTDPDKQEQHVHDQPAQEKSRGRGTHQR